MPCFLKNVVDSSENQNVSESVLDAIEKRFCSSLKSTIYIFRQMHSLNYNLSQGLNVNLSTPLNYENITRKK